MDPAYSAEQIAQYMSYIDLPKRYHVSSKPALDLALLTALHVHQLAKIPYENLSLHYSATHRIRLDPQVLFNKIVVDARGRGGYCMEGSIFFNHVLRAVGFHAYLAGVRIRNRVDGVPQGKFRGWTHVVNIVTLDDGCRYMVDVAFGGDGATKPLPLVANVVTHNIGTQELRLVQDNIPFQVDTSRKLWIYQYRNNHDMAWNSFYSFAEFEFLHNDFEIMNWFTSTSPDSFQTYTTLVVKFLRTEGSDAEDSRIYGKVMLVNGVIKINEGGRTRVAQTCQNEKERVVALKEYFDITLTEDERLGIKGQVSELKDAELAASTG